MSEKDKISSAPAIKKIDRSVAMSPTSVFSSKSMSSSKHDSDSDSDDDGVTPWEKGGHHRKESASQKGDATKEDKTTSKTSFGSSTDGNFTHPLILWYLRNRSNLIKWYYNNVTFKQETLLILLLNFPFLVVGIGLLYKNTLVTTVVELQTLSLIWIIAVHLCNELSVIVNDRHTHLLTMTKVISGVGTIGEIFNPGVDIKSSISRYFSIVFYIIVVLSELLLTNTPVRSFLGSGTALSLGSNMSTISANDTSSNLLFTSMGLAHQCNSCGAIDTGLYSLIPIDTVLISSGQDWYSVFHTATMDIIALQISCISFTANTAVYPGYTLLTPVSLISGVNGASLTMDFASYDPTTFTVKNKRCEISTSDYSGIATTEYAVDGFGKASRSGVNLIVPSNLDTCTQYEDYCLNAPSRSSLSWTLLNAIFGGDPLLVPQTYTYDFGMVADPAWPANPFTDFIYADFLREAFIGYLHGAATNWMTERKTVSLETESVYVIASDETWLTALVVAVSLFCFFQSMFIVSVDFILLKQSSNVFLRRLFRAVSDPDQRMQDFACFVESQVASNDNDDWVKTTKIKFGELKKTVGDEVGQLGFGEKKSIVKFKNQRSYRNL